MEDVFCLLIMSASSLAGRHIELKRDVKNAASNHFKNGVRKHKEEIS